jgi:hypothetical protein
MRDYIDYNSDRVQRALVLLGGMGERLREKAVAECGPWCGQGCTVRTVIVSLWRVTEFVDCRIMNIICDS